MSHEAHPPTSQTLYLSMSPHIPSPSYSGLTPFIPENAPFSFHPHFFPQYLPSHSTHPHFIPQYASFSFHPHISPQ